LRSDLLRRDDSSNRKHGWVQIVWPLCSGKRPHTGTTAPFRMPSVSHPFAVEHSTEVFDSDDSRIREIE
jgi:hypothetical protein